MASVTRRLASVRAIAKRSWCGSAGPAPGRSRDAVGRRPSSPSLSSVDVAEDEVEAGEDRDDVGNVDAAQDPRRDRDVVEAGRADLAPERAEVALRHEVV